MALEWMPRDNEMKNHALHTEVHWGTEAPCTVVEKKPLDGPERKGGGRPVCDLDSPEQPQAIQLLHHRNGQRA